MTAAAATTAPVKTLTPETTNMVGTPSTAVEGIDHTFLLHHL
jgi:hypothetical protein